MDSTQIATHLPSDNLPLVQPADVNIGNPTSVSTDDVNGNDQNDDDDTMPSLVDVKSGPGGPLPSTSNSRSTVPTGTSERVEPKSGSTAPRTVNDVQGKTCWICMEDDSEPSTMKWVHPCSCTLLAHEQCLLVWIASKQQTSASGKEPVTCPQCKTAYVLAETMSRTMQVFNKVDALVGRGCKYFLVGTFASSLVTTSTILGFSSFRFFFGPEVSRIALGTRGPAGWPLWAWTGLPLIPYALILNSVASQSTSLSRFQIIETSTALAPFFVLPRARAFPPTVSFYRSQIQELFAVDWSYPPGPGLTLALVPLVSLAYAGLKRVLFPYVVEGKRLPWMQRAHTPRLPLPAPAINPVPAPAPAPVPTPATAPSPSETAPVIEEPTLAPAPNDQPTINPIIDEDPLLDQPPTDPVGADENEDEFIGIFDEEEFDQGFGEEEEEEEEAEEDDSDDEERELHPFFAQIFGGMDPGRFDDGRENANNGNLFDEDDQPPAETMFIQRKSSSRMICGALLMPIFASYAGDVLLWVAQNYSPSLAKFLGVQTRVGTVGLGLSRRAGSGWGDWLGGLSYGLGIGFRGKEYAGEGLDPVWWRNAVGGMILVLIKDSLSLGHMYLRIQQRKTRRVVSRSFEGLDMSRG